MKQKLIIVIMIVSFLFMCCNYRFPLFNLNIEDAVAQISKGKISVIQRQHIELTYTVGEEAYIEVPQLPGGFFLYYDFGDPYPILSHLISRKTIGIDDRLWHGDIFSIKRICFYDDTFIVESNNLFYKVRYNRGEYFLVNNLEENIKKEFVFIPRQPYTGDYDARDYKVGTGLFCFINGERIIINGVYRFEIGLLGENQKYHIWGESVYGFFDINVETLEICYPLDDTPYNNPIHFDNTRISKNYKEKINNLIRGRNKIDIFYVGSAGVIDTKFEEERLVL